MVPHVSGFSPLPSSALESFKVPPDANFVLALLGVKICHSHLPFFSQPSPVGCITIYPCIAGGKIFSPSIWDTKYHPHSPTGYNYLASLQNVPHFLEINKRRILQIVCWTRLSCGIQCPVLAYLQICASFPWD